MYNTSFDRHCSVQQFFELLKKKPIQSRVFADGKFITHFLLLPSFCKSQYITCNLIMSKPSDQEIASSSEESPHSSGNYASVEIMDDGPTRSRSSRSFIVRLYCCCVMQALWLWTFLRQPARFNVSYVWGIRPTPISARNVRNSSVADVWPKRWRLSRVLVHIAAEDAPLDHLCVFLGPKITSKEYGRPSPPLCPSPMNARSIPANVSSITATIAIAPYALIVGRKWI